MDGRGGAFTNVIEMTKGHNQKSIIAFKIGPIKYGLDLILSGGWWLTSYRLTNTQHSRPWSFESPGSDDHSSGPAGLNTECEIAKDDSMTYKKNVIIVRLRQAIDEELELLKHLPGLYYWFINLFESQLAKSLLKQRRFEHAIELKLGTTAP